MRSEGSAATRLARYALWNLAGAPAWFEELASTHPEPVADAIWTDIERDLKAPMAGNARTAGLDLVMQGPAALKTEIAGRLRERFQQLAPEDSAISDARIRKILEIIRDAGADDDEYLESRVGELLDAHAREGNWQGVGYWLGFLLAIAPARAWAQVETLWNSGMERSETDAARLAYGLTGTSGAVIGAVSALNVLPDSPEMAFVIERMCVFFREHIRRDDDIRRHNGEGYPLGEREVAQIVRDSMAARLVRMPGAAAHESLRRLTVGVKNLPQEEGLLALLRDHASKEAASLVFLKPKDIPNLGDVYCREPCSEADLFQVVLAKLEAIKEGMEAGPYSDRELFNQSSKESELQIWLAARLNDMPGRQFEVSRKRFSVSREDEVDAGKKIDIHVHHRVGKVCLEVKRLNAKQYSVSKLKWALENQLVGQYVGGGRNSHHGILVLFLMTKNRHWQIPGKKRGDFGELLAFLQEYANELAAKTQGVEGLDVIGIDCTGHRVPAAVCEERGRSRQTKGTGTCAAEGSVCLADKQKTRQRRK